MKDKENFADIFCQEILYFKLLKQSYFEELERDLLRQVDEEEDRLKKEEAEADEKISIKSSSTISTSIHTVQDDSLNSSNNSELHAGIPGSSAPTPEIPPAPKGPSPRQVQLKNSLKAIDKFLPKIKLASTADTIALSSTRRRWSKIDFLLSNTETLFQFTCSNLNRQVIFIFFEIKNILEGIRHLTLPKLFNPNDSKSSRNSSRHGSRHGVSSSNDSTSAHEGGNMSDTSSNTGSTVSIVNQETSGHSGPSSNSLGSSSLHQDDPTSINPPSPGSKINLDCFDLASCYQNNKRKFMLIQSGFILLIDPDPKMLGWAIIKKTLSLSRIKIKRIHDTTLQVTVDNRNSAGRVKDVTETFTFEDNIRCSAVAARIGRGRDLYLRDRQNWLSCQLGMSSTGGSVTNTNRTNSDRSPSTTPNRKQYPRQVLPNLNLKFSNQEIYHNHPHPVTSPHESPIRTIQPLKGDMAPGRVLVKKKGVEEVEGVYTV